MQPLRIKNNNSWPSGRHDGRKSHCHVPSIIYMPAHLYIQHLVTLHKHCVNKVGYNKNMISVQHCMTSINRPWIINKHANKHLQLKYSHKVSTDTLMCFRHAHGVFTHISQFAALHVFRAEVCFLRDLICWLKGFAMLQTLSHINVSPVCGMSDQTLSLNYGVESSSQVVEDTIFHCQIQMCFSQICQIHK